MIFLLHAGARDKARQWFQQITRGLSYLHSREIAHRDLKCENILLAQGGKFLKIADFGFTRFFVLHLIKIIVIIIM